MIVILCLLQGHRYAGVESEDECFCGNHIYATESLAIESQSFQNCPFQIKNQRRFCGGHWLIQVYDLGNNGISRSHHTFIIHHYYWTLLFDEHWKRFALSKFTWDLCWFIGHVLGVCEWVSVCVCVSVRVCVCECVCWIHPAWTVMVKFCLGWIMLHE